MGSEGVCAGSCRSVALAKGVPTWVLCPALLSGSVWLSIGRGLRVLGINGERTAAVDVRVDCDSEGDASVVCTADALAPFVQPLKLIGPVMDVEIAGGLTLKVPLDRRVIAISLPADVEEIPKMRLPEPKFRGPAYGVFEETVKQLRRLKGSDSVRVRVRVEGDRMVIEPPRRVILLRSESRSGSEQGLTAESGIGLLEVKILFRDLRRVLEVFGAADLAPSKLWLSDSILGLEADYGGATVRGVIAGQID